MTDQIFPDESLHRFRQDPHHLPRIPPADSAVPHRGLTDHILSAKMKSKTANTGFNPPAASPAANVTPCSSATQPSKTIRIMFKSSKSGSICRSCDCHNIWISGCLVTKHFTKHICISISVFLKVTLPFSMSKGPIP